MLPAPPHFSDSVAVLLDTEISQMSKSETVRDSTGKSSVASPPGENGLLSRVEAASYLKLKKGTLESWVSRRPGYLPMCRLGRLVKYRKCDLDEFIEKNMVRTADEGSQQ